MEKQKFSFIKEDTGKKIKFYLDENKISQFEFLRGFINFNKNNLKKTIELEEQAGEAIKYITENPFNFLMLDKETREYYSDYLGYNPNLYPEEYAKLYENEKNYRHLQGYEKLINITDENFSGQLEDDNIIKCAKEDDGSNKEKNLKLYGNIFDCFKKLIGDYKNNCCIAGGFASGYVRNSRIASYTDIDIFIHSCDREKALKMIAYFGENSRKNNHNLQEIVNENSITFINHIDNIGVDSFQFILRLYNSPSEIVHGFDVDASCVLLNSDGEFFATERGYYALKNNVNIFNFDRLSPSYEYRLLKYVNKGFNLYLPEKKFFLENVITDLSTIPRPVRGGNVINIDLIMNEFGFYSGLYESNSDYSDVMDNGRKNIINSETENKMPGDYRHVKFKSLNPSEQSIGTFHRIVLENLISWYPNASELKFFSKPKLEKIDKFMPFSEKFSISSKMYKISSEDFLFLDNQNKIKPYKNLLCPLIPRTKKTIDDDGNKRILNNFIKKFNGELLVGGDYAISYLLNTKISGSVDFYFLNAKNPEQLKSFIIKDFIKYYIYRVYNKNRHRVEKTTTVKHYECEEFMSIDADVQENVYMEYFIPKIKIFNKNFTSYSEIMETQELDFMKVLLVPSKTQKIGEFILNNHAKYAIMNRMHFSTEIEPDEEIMYYAYKKYFEKGFRLLYNSEKVKIPEFYDNISYAENFNIKSDYKKKINEKRKKKTKILGHDFEDYDSDDSKAPSNI